MTSIGPSRAIILPWPMQADNILFVLDVKWSINWIVPLLSSFYLYGVIFLGHFIVSNSFEFFKFGFLSLLLLYFNTNGLFNNSSAFGRYWGDVFKQD